MGDKCGRPTRKRVFFVSRSFVKRRFRVGSVRAVEKSISSVLAFCLSGGARGMAFSMAKG
eukprot:scaffold9945_cov182-Amphora_coffeaeformis.AAC.4